MLVLCFLTHGPRIAFLARIFHIFACLKLLSKCAEVNVSFSANDQSDKYFPWISCEITYLCLNVFIFHSEIHRRWVARIFTVWRTHFRTFIIVSHALAHRTSIFDNRTRTRTFSKRVQFFWWFFKKKNVALSKEKSFCFYLAENVPTT